MLMIRAVLFDMDGLVLDTESRYEKALRQAGRMFGYEMTDTFLERARGVERSMFYDMIFREFGQDFPARSYSQTYRKLFWDMAEKKGIRVKKGTKELTEYLMETGIPFCLATSNDRDTTQRLLKMAGIRELFEHIVCGDEVPRGKPYPDIYLKAAEQLNESAENCLVLEDSGNGIRAGYNAGCATCLVPDLQIPEDVAELCNIVIDDLLGVKKWLIRQRAGYLN